MIDDGVNVILSDELKTRLYMTADDLGGIDIESGQKDPTYGMTPAQRKRYEKRLLAKPRPRDLFNVQELIKKRDAKIDELKRKMDAKKEQEKNTEGGKEIIVRIRNDMTQIDQF
mmetsp:Transcript_23477/g.31465  ORF Transcript_23477/g.31465 Transcript_23477/m.31465 type:complete len:114 (-) Transcript_23477:286-627(-)